MAYLSKAKITENISGGTNIKLECLVHFQEVDKQLNLGYSAQAFIYDEDYGSDILVPLIENLYCTTDIHTIADREDGKDDLIKSIKFGSFKASGTPKKLSYEFELQEYADHVGILVSRATLKAQVGS